MLSEKHRQKKVRFLKENSVQAEERTEFSLSLRLFSVSLSQKFRSCKVQLCSHSTCETREKLPRERGRHKKKKEKLNGEGENE